MKRGVVLILALFLCFVGTARATIGIIDQQYTVGGGINTSFDWGQSFTPTLGSISVADFSLRQQSTFGSIRLDIFAGVGYVGPILGSSAPVTFTNTSFQLIEFTFLTPVSLIPGSPYTIRMTRVGGDPVYEYDPFGTYSGGTMVDQNGSTSFGDVRFAEGVVPEPSTVTLVLISAAAIAFRISRKRSSET